MSLLWAFVSRWNSFTLHRSRHSWATIAKSKGLSIAVISECLGHSDQKTTEIYLGSLERSALERASRMVSEAIIPKATKPTKQGKFVEGEVPR